MYPLGMALGLAYLTGGLVGQALAVRRGVSSARWWWVVVALMAVTVVGARLAYVFPDAAYYLQSPGEVWLPPIEGLSFTGGLVVGAVCAVVASRLLGLSLLSLADVIGLSYLAGSIVAGVAWRTPVSLEMGTPGWAALLDGLYVTGLYFLLWWLWTQERSFRRAGTAAAVAAAGDVLLRLGVGSIGELAHATGDAGAPWLPAVWLALMVVAAGFLVARGVFSRPPGGIKPFHRPLRRWVGWFVVYGLLMAAFIGVRT